jgi:hypothetical protein
MLRPALVAVSLLTLSTTGCLLEADEPDDVAEDIDSSEEASSPGVNGKACLHSPYNCKLRAKGGQRVPNANDDSWAVDDAPAVDGNGNLMMINTRDHLVFNYGQDRHINGVTYAFALSTSNGSAAWFPMSAIKSESIFRDRVGEVNAKDTGGKRLGCYAIRDSVDESLIEKKVVYDTTASHQRAGDYLPLQRKNGHRYANLAFNVPGFALGGPAIDIYPSGTKFQRVHVPTDTGRPSIDIPLWIKDGQGRYRKQDGKMKFVYGYVRSAAGSVRFGWMAYPALKVSSGCS